MKDTLRHGKIIDVLHRAVISQGNSKMITLTEYLEDCGNVTIYILSDNKRYLSIEIDKKPEGV